MLLLKKLVYHPPVTPTPILKGINLELEPKELGLIIGPSGSGKTTLLEILAGLAEKTGGEILWRDQDLIPEDLRELGGIVFQFPERHFCCNSVVDELRLGHPELDLQKVKDALKEVGLDQISLQTSPHALSGGQQRRLALAVQLIRQPSILMLDEPTAGLDWSIKKQLTKLLIKLKEHWTILIVTHDPEELLSVADRCWRINDGTLEVMKLDNLSNTQL